MGLQVVPLDVPLLKMWGASSEPVWHLGITLVDVMGHILSPERVVEPFGEMQHLCHGQCLPEWGQFPQAGRELMLSPSVIPGG